MGTHLITADTPLNTYDRSSDGSGGALPSERYGALVRVAAATGTGLIAGVLLMNAAQVGAGFAFGERLPDHLAVILWGEHWAWRGVWSMTATFLAGFLAGMIARRRGALVGGLVGTPSAIVWGIVALTGWLGHFPGGTSAMDVPMGYRIIACVLTLATVPMCIAGARAGVPFGAANGPHFDGRRGTLLGVRWYHYLWLHLPLHLLAVQASWALMYSFNWLVLSWKAGPSVFGVIPGLFLMGMVATMHLTTRGALRAYEALADLDDDQPVRSPVWKRVATFGFGYPLAACALQLGITLLHGGVSRLFGG